MVSRLYSMGLYGMDAFVVEVEADISVGLPAFDVVDYITHSILLKKSCLSILLLRQLYLFT
jgi:hypothetical protein